MNWVVYHVASGQAFFSGVVLLIIATYASTRRSVAGRSIAILGFLIGAMAIAISSTAIPYWYYTIAVIVTIGWLAIRYSNKVPRWAPCVVAFAWIGAGLLEIRYHILPHIEPAPSRSVAVIGDSITAGMGASDRSVKWPALLAEQYNLDMRDLSHPGETTASALKRARDQEIVAPIVILEIGGNDLLGSTTSAQFALDLDALLAYVEAPGRQLVLFELPLPPFNHEYGRIQRALARKYDVALIPKRVLLSVLAENGSTVDTIHLTQAGHERMAAHVWELVGSAFPITAELSH